MQSTSTQPEPPQYSADPHFCSEWDKLYQKDGLTDWELLPPEDLINTLSSAISRYGLPETAIDVGCGRGLRILATILGLKSLNTESFRLRGVDHSRTAIATASTFATLLRQQEPIPEPFATHMSSVALSSTGPLRAAVKFEAADLFDWLRDASGLPVDLVIDWMCLHEIPRDERPLYAQLLTRACKRLLVLNTFSVEGSTVSDLGCIGERIPKYQLSRHDILALFGKSFSIVSTRLVPEDLNPATKPSDQIIAAKSIYMMVRSR